MEQPNTYSTDYAQPDSTLLLQYNFCMNETSHLGMPSEGELIFMDRNSISVSAYKRNNCLVSSSGVKKELLHCTAGHCRRIHHDGPVSWCDVHPWSLSSQATISQFHPPPQKLPQDLSNITLLQRATAFRKVPYVCTYNRTFSGKGTTSTSRSVSSRQLPQISWDCLMQVQRHRGLGVHYVLLRLQPRSLLLVPSSPQILQSPILVFVSSLVWGMEVPPLQHLPAKW